MTCRCVALSARIAAIEARLGISAQPSLFGASEPEPTETPPKYTAAFEEVWERTGRVGTKLAAYRAWVLVKRPPWSAVSPGWAAYMRSARPVEGFVQDLSRWLKNRGWQQSWAPARPKAAPIVESGPKYVAPRSSCFPHAENPRCRTRRPVPGCPECDEQAAREAGRTMSEEQVLEMPPWADVAGGAK